VSDRGCSDVPGEEESEREKNDGEIQMWEREERSGIGCKERREGAGCAARRERRSSTCAPHGCGEMREREGKERREILSEDGREIGWMKEIWKRERIEKEREGKKIEDIMLFQLLPP
jgi:hypothetical protein